MAYFMLNDRPDFFEQGLNTLEKLTHQYHMHEIYAAAAPIYKKMKENPPTDVELCGCVNDITGNGILIEMANIARQLKYFQSKRRPRQLLCNTLNVYTRAYRNYGDSCSSTRSYGTFPLPSRPRIQKRSAAELDKAKITEQDKPEDNKNGDLEGGDANIGDLEGEYLSNPTHETALSLLAARPWLGKTLVSLAFPFCSHSISCSTVRSVSPRIQTFLDTLVALHFIPTSHSVGQSVICSLELG